MEPGKILVVEDSATQRAIYKELLSKEGYQVFDAIDGADALQKVKLHYPDIIITDINMPRMDGFEMIRILKGDEKTKYIPIVCVSATYMDISNKMRTLIEIGAEEYFYATENKEELLAKVIVMMRIRKLYIELIDKNRQLKVFNDAAVGRELKMIELKNTIKSLEEELGKYKNK
jgi:CheY-like chemotaxis protein